MRMASSHKEAIRCSMRVPLLLPLLRRSPPYSTRHLAMSRWDERYATEEYAYGTEPNEFLRENVALWKLPPDAKCLLVADGEGRNGVFLAEQGYSVLSMDASEVGLKKAKTLAAQRHVSIETVLADLTDFPFGSSQWDCIVGIFCHVPPVARTRMLEQIPDALVPNGVFALECYTPEQIGKGTGGPPTPDMMYSSAMLEEAFRGKLVVERNQELDRDVVEGVYHTGPASVVQFVGRRPS